MNTAYVFLGIASSCVLSFGFGYSLGNMAFGKRNASIKPGYTESEIYGAFEGAIMAEFEVSK
jgi:hypothetical protein